VQIFLSKADVYWVANSPDIFVVPLVVKRANYILDYRGPWPQEVELEFGKGTLSCIARFLTRTALKNAGALTLTTSTLKKDVKGFGKKVYVIPNYPLKSSFKPNVSSAQFRKKNNVQEGQKVVLFTGRLSVVEGFDILPSIVEKLVSKGKDIVFWIVGDGMLTPLALELEKKFPQNVKFFGWRPYEEIPNFVNAADVCIVPRLKTPFSNYYNEEGVHKISEYMFFRKPIVACGIAPSKEYLLVELQDMANGILQALVGKVPQPTPRTWEDDCKEKVIEVVDFVKKF
jgi:glycosyltransferase involved in cell wall biosynthesis